MNDKNRAPQDQPRPTPPQMDIGGSDAFHDWPKREAQGEAPQNGTVCKHGVLCELCRMETGAHPSQDARAGIYVASRASIPARSEMWRKLRHGGIKINATWIDEAGENATQSFSELWSRIEREIRSSTGLVLYAEEFDFPLKGALIEVGMALAMGIRVIVVAPGVLMNPRNFKPFGSWAKHPLVTFEESLGIACKQAGARSTPSLPAQDARWIKIAAQRIAEFASQMADACWPMLESSRIETIETMIRYEFASGSTPSPDPPPHDSELRQQAFDATWGGPHGYGQVVKLEDAEIEVERLREALRLAEAKGKLDQFLRMKKERPMNPIYWDMHEENDLRAALGDPERKEAE